MFKLFKRKRQEKQDKRRVCFPLDSSKRPTMSCAICKRKYYMDEPIPQCVKLEKADERMLAKIGR